VMRESITGYKIVWLQSHQLMISWLLHTETNLFSCHVSFIKISRKSNLSSSYVRDFMLFC
jgi:hypothetical protein